MVNWHRLFGLALIDLFTGSPYEVELEKDLSLRQQFLDVVVIRKTGGAWTGILPDGLDNLADHNLITYKSLHEPLDDWAVHELIGHYVNYRKQISGIELLPEDNFKLYGVATRFPSNLAKQVKLKKLQPGIYQVVYGASKIRIVVLSKIPKMERNAMWHLFSGVAKLVNWCAAHYRTNIPNMSSIMNQLFAGYQDEGVKVSYTVEDFQLDVTRQHVHRLSLSERLQGLSTDELLRRVPSEERLRGLPPEERLRGLPPEAILRGLSAEDIDKLKLLLQESPRPVH